MERREGRSLQAGQVEPKRLVQGAVNDPIWLPVAVRQRDGPDDQEGYQQWARWKEEGYWSESEWAQKSA